MSDFKSFKLPTPLIQAIDAMSFQTPTPIQAQAIPIALQGHDLIGTAQTGTGKTAAFLIPTLVRLSEAPNKVALVLAPTRELVQQIEIVWKALTRFMPEMRSALLIGGTSMQPQYRALKQNPRLIVATPGRLLDHAGQRTVNLSRVDTLVLDEADRMLDMGFAPQLNQILRLLPQQRQTLLFTATWSSEMDQLSKKYSRNPQRVSIGAISRATTQVTQELVRTTIPKKNETLLDELNRREGSVLVFARTQSRTDRVAKYLGTYGMQVARLHGGRTQGQRNSALKSFRSGQMRVLIATDIAARGIDVTEIQHVINFDLPQNAEDYVHRIGRTGRAGATGTAVSFLTPEDRSQWNEIVKLLKKTGSRIPESPQATHVKN